MATPSVPLAEARRRIKAVNDALRKGHRPPGIPGAGPGALAIAADALGLSPGAMSITKLQALKRAHKLAPDWKLYQPRVAAPHPPRMTIETEAAPDAEIPEAPAKAAFDLVATLRKGPLTLAEIAQKSGLSRGQVLDLIDRHRSDGMNLKEFSGRWSLEKTMALRESGAAPQFDLVSDAKGVHRFGFVTDNHIGSKYARLDVLNDLYDRFQAAGITRVYNAGNWIDGEARFNKNDLVAHGMDPQLDLLVKDYPQRPGIETYAVAGDDHEGWYGQREGVDIGRYAERKMRAAGRTDWHYMGFMEADVKLIHATTQAMSVMRVVHPGGGSAYAISYAPQKIVESFEGGDKPAVLLVGHYHKQDIFNYRNVWIYQGGTTEDQTPFMRKKKIEAHVGGTIVTLDQDAKSGAITGANGMWRYFNRGFYEERNDRWSLSGPVRQPKRSPGGV